MGIKLPKDTRKKVEKAGTGKGVNMAALTPASPVKKGKTTTKGGWVCELPLCPSSNGLFFNRIGGRTRTGQYNEWIERAAPLVRAMPKITAYPVSITLTIRGRRGFPVTSDAANREKAATDLLVEEGILIDDSRKYVTSHTQRYEDADCQAFLIVKIDPA